MRSGDRVRCGTTGGGDTTPNAPDALDCALEHGWDGEFCVVCFTTMFKRVILAQKKKKRFHSRTLGKPPCSEPQLLASADFAPGPQGAESQPPEPLLPARPQSLGVGVGSRSGERGTDTWLPVTRPPRGLEAGMDFHSALLQPKSSHPEILAPPPTSLPHFPSGCQEGRGLASGSDRGGQGPGHEAPAVPGPRCSPPFRARSPCVPPGPLSSLSLFPSSPQTWRGLRGWEGVMGHRNLA